MVAILFAMLAAPSFADGASRTKRAISAGRAAGFDPVAREKLVIAHIKQRLGSYGDSIVTDPRFAIDPTMFVRVPNQKPAVPKRRPDYDYVFSPWSKEEGRRFLEDNANAWHSPGSFSNLRQ